MRRLTPRGQERRDQLMDFAARRFAAQGYHPTSVAEITEGLGVGKGVFYWYFESKDQLFRELLAASHLALRKAQQRAITEVEDPVERIAAGVRASLVFFADHPHLFTLFQLAATSEEFAPAMRKGQQVAIADTVRHVKEAMAVGRIGETDPELVAHAIVGAMTEVVRTFLHQGDQRLEDVARATVRFCLRGLEG